MNDQMEQCMHVWVYDRIDMDVLYMKCQYCGQIRPSMPGEVAARVSRELKIRHDETDGDV